jgi:hypothetical protein
LKWNSLDTHAAVIAWDDEAEEGTASYSISLPEGAAQTGLDDSLIFSLSVADEETLPEDWEEEDEEDGEAEEEAEETEQDDEPEPLDWSIVLTDAAGQSAGLTLGQDRLLYPQVQAPTRRASFLEFLGTSEVVLHRYAFALGEFVELNPAFDASAIREIRFVFDANPEGVVIIDDVGFAGVDR